MAIEIQMPYVVCDTCNDDAFITLEPFFPITEGRVAKHLKEGGWKVKRVEGEYLLMCPECVAAGVKWGDRRNRATGEIG